MEIREYGKISKKKQYWVVLLLLLPILIFSGGVLIYQWKNEQNQQEQRRQKMVELETKLKELELQAKQQRLAENYLTSTASLVNNSKVHAFFSDLLNTYSEKFAKSKEVNIYSVLLQFEGFHFDPKTGSGGGVMGRCFPEEVIYPNSQKEANISLNRLYLLNKLGIDRYFANEREYIDVSFKKMLETCSHEISHYIQYVKHGKSSCESDLSLNNGNYSAELAKEHGEWTQEIYQLIKEDFPQLEQKWKEI